MLDLHKARLELAKNTIQDIERSTALTWGSRAAAAFAEAQVEPDDKVRLQWLWDGENYRQEAIEHAAMVEDFAFLEELMNEIEVHRQQAKAAVAGTGLDSGEPAKGPGARRPGARPRAHGQPRSSAPRSKSVGMKPT
jgi:hypothetical protein